jgi:hypothetical protein
MTKFTSPLPEAVRHESVLTLASKRVPGVTYSIRRVSFAGRLELAQMIRTLDRRLEFLQAGADAASKVDAAIVTREIDGIYLAWGLTAIDGLMIDGETATPGAVIERGPEELIDEALAAIKSECGLSGEERKN